MTKSDKSSVLKTVIVFVFIINIRKFAKICRFRDDFRLKYREFLGKFLGKFRKNFVKIVNFKSVLYLYQDEFIQTLNSQYPESPEKIDVVQPENAPSNENFKNEEFHSQEENFQNFDSIDLENHPEIRKYLDQKYPDDPNEPKKKLIIISAMFRSGSSFMGSLFGTGPKPNLKLVPMIVPVRSNVRSQFYKFYLDP